MKHQLIFLLVVLNLTHFKAPEILSNLIKISEEYQKNVPNNMYVITQVSYN